ncbi:MAG TPA: hypothetical protein VKU19_42425 [Bryobacteraceae bacterium]|nr:hypothetical protein [Bryobacteraceae bacterium]
METLEKPIIDESPNQNLQPSFEEDLDVLAFELWQRGSRQDLAAEEEAADDEETVGCHASCL